MPVFEVTALDKKTRSRLKEHEKMSKLFTKSRRTEAKKHFKSRLEMNQQKAKIKKRQLEKKFYDFDFKPKTNKKRIDIYARNLPSKVIQELEKKKQLKLKKKIREQQETAFGSAFDAPFKPKNAPKKPKVTEMKFLQFSEKSEEPSERNFFGADAEGLGESGKLAQPPFFDPNSN